MKKETLGAKIRNRLSPYLNISEMALDDRFSDSTIRRELSKDIHQDIISELILISHECEIDPSEELVNKLSHD